MNGEKTQWFAMYGPWLIVILIAAGIIFLASTNSNVSPDKTFNMTASLARDGDHILVNTTITGERKAGPVSLTENCYVGDQMNDPIASLERGNVSGVFLYRFDVGQDGGNVSVLASDNVTKKQVTLPFQPAWASPRFNLS